MSDEEEIIPFDQTIFQLPSCLTVHAQLYPHLRQWTSDQYVDYLRRRTPHCQLCGVLRRTPSGPTVIALAMYRIFDTSFDTVRFEVDDLVVDENERNRGLATRLMQYLIDRAKPYGGKLILVHCDLTNTKAHRLLFRLGFSIVVFQFVLECNVSSSDSTVQIVDVTDENDEEIWRAVQRVHRELRPHLSEDFYNYREQMRTICQQGPAKFIVARDYQEKQVLGLAVYRQTHRMQYSDHIYVDDLVSTEQQRSRGVGKSLINFIKAKGEKLGIKRIILDSGCQRGQAHKFYYREGFQLDQFGFGLSF